MQSEARLKFENKFNILERTANMMKMPWSGTVHSRAAKKDKKKKNGQKPNFDKRLNRRHYFRCHASPPLSSSCLGRGDICDNFLGLRNIFFFVFTVANCQCKAASDSKLFRL